MPLFFFRKYHFHYKKLLTFAPSSVIIASLKALTEKQGARFPFQRAAVLVKGGTAHVSALTPEPPNERFCTE